MARAVDVAGWDVVFHAESKNEARVSPCGLFIAMILTRGMATIIDAIRWPEVRVWRWHAYRDKSRDKSNHYAARMHYLGGTSRKVRMHAVLLAKGCDHIDGDGLNNTCENLRLATHSQQMRNRRIMRCNTLGFVGVAKRHRCWSAYIWVEGRNRYLGSFATPEDAARAYDAALRELNTPFARYNFPRPGERGVHDRAEVLA